MNEHGNSIRKGIIDTGRAIEGVRISEGSVGEAIVLFLRINLKRC